MPSVSGANLRALFSQRKKRSNAGKSRKNYSAGVEYGPMFIGPLRPQNTRRARKTRSNAGVKRAVETANLLGLAGMKIVGQRKTRKNKGVKRGPRHFPRNTNLFN